MQTNFSLAIVVLVACSSGEEGNAPGAGGSSREDCVGLPALTPVSHDYAPVLGEGAMVVRGQVCDPREAPSFTWTIVSAPAGTTDDDLVTYQDHDYAEALFVNQDVGTYIVAVVVADHEGDASDPDYFLSTVSGGNVAPVADCGDDSDARVGAAVTLDGTGSYDPEGLPLTYEWAFDEVSVGSAVVDDALDDLATSTPSFVPDVGGDFVLALQVSDGETWSPPDLCTVRASD